MRRGYDPGMAYLRYLSETGQISTCVLGAGRFVIGRSEAANLFFDSDTISREHLVIEMEANNRFRIRDLGSRNKSYVNGELIAETLLNPGDIIRAGDRIAEFVDEDAEPTKIDLDFLTPDTSEPAHCDWLKTKIPVSLTTTQLEQLAYLSGDQALTARAEDIADVALSRVILTTQAERGFIALRGKGKADLHIIAHRALALGPDGSRTPVSHTFVHTPALQGTAGRYPETAAQIDAKQGFAATAIVAPLMFQGQIIGLIYVDRPGAKRPLTPAALQFAMAAGAQIGAMLGEASRKLARLAPREGHAWMTTIRRVQSALTTSVTSNAVFSAAHRLHPGRARCGDFALVVPLDEQRCCIAMMDGGGHGVTGLAQAVSTLAAIRAAIAVSEDTLMDPSNLFHALNDMVASSPARQVLPCTYVGIDMASGKLSYICAGGRAPVLMVAPGRLVTLDQPSLVLGVDPDYVYEATRVTLPQRYRIICHTDGIVDCTNSGNEPLGDKRLHEALLEHDAFGSADEVLTVINGVIAAHTGRTQSDDDGLAVVVAYA